MNHLQLYNNTCQECSRLITKRYSTSFSLGIRMFDKRFRSPICAIYGFVRFADEIVDTFHTYDKKNLLDRFRADTYQAIDEKISLNPVLNAFQEVVHLYSIDQELIDAFLYSMELDLYHDKYEDSLYKTYIYGSAEVVGLMCLKVFCEGNDEEYLKLRDDARSLGAAFQKINFLRDMKSDYDERGRTYFPGVDYTKFDNQIKKDIEEDIYQDFKNAYRGILGLPKGCRLGVYVAYKYYLNLFKKIQKAEAERVQEERIRVNNGKKMYILFKSMVRASFNIL
ncbi:MAG: phytoene/squalene synthase family protein [Saprospiraceae bacterium]|nr:phytoene/squalene synthase family protein [Saprospiraceae bacterium]